MTSGVVQTTCGELESISGCKVMILLCHKLTATDINDLIMDAKN